jgi:hypothetical protein
MRVAVAVFLGISCLTVLQACGKRSGNDIADNLERLHRCESLEPLLAALPSESTLEGLPTHFRGCIAPSEVAVTYRVDPELPEYWYSIQVIDEKSKYLEAFLGEQEVDGLDVGALRIGLHHDAVMKEWYTCRGNLNDPPAERRHIFWMVGDFEMCVSAAENEQKRVTKVISVRDDLVYELTLQAHPTGEPINLEKAARAIEVAFAKFNPKALR